MSQSRRDTPSDSTPPTRKPPRDRPATASPQPARPRARAPAPGPATEPPAIAKNLDELAAAVGISRRQLIRLRHRGLPGGTGRYDVTEIRQWLAARGGGDESDGNERTRLELERLRAEVSFRRRRAQLAKVALEEHRGELILLEDVERERVARILEVRQALETLGARVVPQLQGLEVDEQIAIVDEHVRAICDRFARGGTTRRRIGRDFGRARKQRRAPPEMSP